MSDAEFDAEFVPYGDGVLAEGSAQWFAALLHRVPGLEIRSFQEDWGAGWFARRNGEKFWIGLQFWEERSWLAEFHHDSWLQRRSSSGQDELKRLLADVHDVLTSEVAISDVAWAREPHVSWLHPLVHDLDARRYNSLPPPQVWLPQNIRHARTYVTFRHPAVFVPYGDGVPAADSAQWFAALLRRVPGLAIEDDLRQEDWGVAVSARRNRRKFWIDLSYWDEGAWLAHIHRDAWFQRLSSSGQNELKRLLADVHEVLTSEAAISDVAWWRDPEVPMLHPLVNNLIARRYNSLPPPQVWRAKA
jgi:hypothetical protein